MALPVPVASMIAAPASGPAPGLTPFIVFNVFAYGAKGDGVTDDTAAIQAAVNAAGSGGVVWFPGGYTYLVASGPITLAPGYTRWVTLWGYGATIALTNTCRTFLYFSKTVDYCTFQNIAVYGFNVDASAVNSFPGGSQHAIAIGPVISNTYETRINFNHIRIRDLTGVAAANLLSATYIRYWIAIITSQANHGASEPTTNTVNDVLIQNCTFTGAEYGFIVGGLGNAGSFADYNMTFDSVGIENCSHDTGAVSNLGQISANFQIGSRAAGGKAWIRNCYGANSGDVGVEIDNTDWCVVENVTILDPHFTAFLFTNFVAPQNPDLQWMVWKNCHARYVNQTFVQTAFSLTNQLAIALGRISFIGCSYYKNSAYVFQNNVGDAFHFPTLTFVEIEIQDFNYVSEGTVYNSGSNIDHYAIYVNSAGSRGIFKLTNLRYSVAGAISGGGNILEYMVIFAGGPLEVQVDGVEFNAAWTGQGNFSTLPFYLGQVGITMFGTFRRCFWNSFSSGDTAPRFFAFAGTANLSIPSGANILIYDMDLTGFPAGGTPYLFVTKPQNQDRIRITDPARNSGVVAVGASYTAQLGIDRFVQVTAAGQTITLPSPSHGFDWWIVVLNGSIGGGSTTIQSASGNINGAATQTLTGNYVSMRFCTIDGANWFTW